MSTDETKYLFLDQIYGWNEHVPPGRKVADGLATTPEGHRRLFALPGRSSLLVDSGLQESAFICPSAIAMNPFGKVGVVDAADQSGPGLPAPDIRAMCDARAGSARARRLLRGVQGVLRDRGLGAISGDLPKDDPIILG